MEFRAISIEEVAAESLRMLRERKQAVIAGIVGYALLNLLSNLVGGTGVSIGAMIGEVMLQCLIVQQLFGQPAGPSATRSYRTVLGASLLTGIAIMLGLVLVIVPGIVLMARWFVVTPLIVRDDMKVGEALRTSWAATRPSQGVFLTLSILYCLAIAAWMGGGMLAAKLSGLGPQSPYVSIPADLFGAAIVVSGWVVSAAAAQALSPSGNRLQAVFS